MSNVESVPWCGDAGIFFVELLFSDGFGKVAGSKKGVIVVKVVEWLVWANLQVRMEVVILV